MTPTARRPVEPTRPDLPPGYGIKPPTEGRLIEWSSVEARLRDARNYWLVTSSPSGKPHAAPLWGVWEEGRFYFGTDPVSRKGVNLGRNAAVVVHLESGDEVVILEGTARLETDETLLARLDTAYKQKYGFPLKGSPVYGVEIHIAFAWSEADFPQSATRWRFST